MNSKKVALIDYGMGNLRSVQRALEAAGAKVVLATSPESIEDVSALIFPGQGAIVDAMCQLRKTGFDVFIKNWIADDKPFMGICLGLQLLFEHSEEGNTDGLGIFRGNVKKFPENSNLKVPHMGWNTISINGNNKGSYAEALKLEGESFYFVHSYYVETPESSIIWSTSEYGLKFVSGIRRGNVFAVQFHPEKSQEKGLQLYRNFLESL